MDQTYISCTGRRILSHWASSEALDPVLNLIFSCMHPLSIRLLLQHWNPESFNIYGPWREKEFNVSSLYPSQRYPFSQPESKKVSFRHEIIWSVSSIYHIERKHSRKLLNKKKIESEVRFQKKKTMGIYIYTHTDTSSLCHHEIFENNRKHIYVSVCIIITEEESMTGNFKLKNTRCLFKQKPKENINGP